MSYPSRPIIDAHIHPAFDEGTSFNSHALPCDMETQVKELRRAGIAKACGAPVRRMTPATFDEVRALNDGALRLRDRFPEFYIPGVHVHPRFPEESCREIERLCGGENVRWIGELVGYLMGYAEEYDTPDALTIFRVAAQHNAVVNFHCGDLGVIDRLCAALPTLRLVLAHPGDGQSYRERLALVVKHPNLRLDLSGTGIDRMGFLRTGIDAAGPEKFLFGTDYPINNPAVYVHGVAFEPLTEAEFDAVFSGNFRRLTTP